MGVKHNHMGWLAVLLLSGLPAHLFAQTTALGSSQSVGLKSVSSAEKRMEFAFQDIPVRALLQLLGETAGVNVVTDESVNGTITLNLKNATWQEALDVIVRAKNLRTEQSGGTVYVKGLGVVSGFAPSADAMGGYDYGMASSYDAIVLQYQKAEDVRAMIGRDGQRLLSEQGSVTADPITNQLLIQDSPDRIAQIRGLIERIDKPGRQVLIEARIVEAEDSFSRSLGVKLGFNDRSHLGYRVVPDPNDASKTITIAQPVSGSGVVFGGNTAAVQGLSGQTTLTNAISTANQMINFPAAISAAGVDPASFAMSLFNSSLTRFVNLEISALETDGKGKIISNPRVVTSNNIKAIIEQGTEIPYQESTSSGATNVAFRKANLKLEVTPQIAPNGEVVLDVDVTKDSVGTRTNEGYAINTKHVKTQVKIDNGGTLVIGGIYQEDNRRSVDKVPLLGDIPVLGNLFKTTTRSVSKNELLIFLTPHILDARGNILPAKVNAVGIDD